MTSSDMPAFGEVDLSNCEREQIHLAGSIQPHGALLVLDEDADRIVQASANAAAFLNLRHDPVGRQLSSLPGTMAGRLRAQLDQPLHRRPAAVRGHIGEPLLDVEALIHRPPDGGIIVEFERPGDVFDLKRALEAPTQAILNAASLPSLCNEAATIVETLTGYDRVMVYRFDALGHGEVFAERRRPDSEAFLGNRYPASDIPQIARRLYAQTRIRQLVDAAYTPVPLTPRLSPLTGRELDMSLCSLRSMSPIHLQYLKNMGVAATLVMSLMIGDELWGLIACHHDTPKAVSLGQRAVCEILAELVATRIAALECVVHAQSEVFVRRLEQRLVEAISRDGDWRMALFDGSLSLLQTLNATGAALLFEGQVQTTGDVPGTREIREIGAWLDGRPREPVMATAALGTEAPGFAGLTATAAGIMATPVSASPGEYLIWFRCERVRTVTWGGDPRKPVIVGTDPAQLSPRLSFAQWHEVVAGTSDPWTSNDRTTARLIRNTVADIILQFRSVRMLIAQDQLESLSRLVQTSQQPMVIANPSGRVILTNEAFEALLQPGHPSLSRLEDLPQFFAEPLQMRRQIDDLLREGRPWRGEVTLAALTGTARPLATRAEAVQARPGHRLGYVLHFEDVTDRKAAETARRHFQDGMIDSRSLRPARLDADGDRDYGDLLTKVVENAQLAALEITYGVDQDRVPRMLEAVRSSVARTADLLEHLIWHTSGVDSGR